MPDPTLSIVIQAGGESRRMGQDKALIPFLGRPLIERVRERIGWLAEELIVTTNQPEKYGFLGAPLFTDLLPGHGALGGLYTALSVAQHSLVVVVACDMPFLNPELVSVEIDLLMFDPELDGVIPRTQGGLEPFHAVYRRESCLPLVKEALESGNLRVDAWFSRANLRILSPEEIAGYDPRMLSFWNVNTPDDLARAEKLASKEGEGES